MAQTRTLFFTLCLLFSPVSLAQGGPPLVTDDPGTVEDGHWEINIATLVSTTSGSDDIRIPYFDINYGWGERTQLKVETGWVFGHYNDGQDQHANGADTLLMGVKHRFVDESTAGVDIATYPQFQFHSVFSNNNPYLSAPGNEVFLPLEFAKTFGAWGINPEIGYLYCSTLPSLISYGVAVAYEQAKPWEPLFEVHGTHPINATGAQYLFNIGFRRTLSDHFILLFAAGESWTQTPRWISELDIYFGVQLHL